MLVSVACGFAAPLKSSHILWINLITDSLPALALGVDEEENKSYMDRPPRGKDESLFAGGGLNCTCFYGALIALISMVAFLQLPVGDSAPGGKSDHTGCDKDTACGHGAFKPLSDLCIYSAWNVTAVSCDRHA